MATSEALARNLHPLLFDSPTDFIRSWAAVSSGRPLPHDLGLFQTDVESLLIWYDMHIQTIASHFTLSDELTSESPTLQNAVQSIVRLPTLSLLDQCTACGSFSQAVNEEFKRMVPERHVLGGELRININPRIVTAASMAGSPCSPETVHASNIRRTNTLLGDQPVSYPFALRLSVSNEHYHTYHSGIVWLIQKSEPFPRGLAQCLAYAFLIYFHGDGWVRDSSSEYCQQLYNLVGVI